MCQLIPMRGLPLILPYLLPQLQLADCLRALLLCEIRKVTGISGLTLTVAALDYAHNKDDGVIYTTDSATNVKWFGAKGDGTTDDTTAIQRAIDQADDQNLNTVFVPPGTYDISSSLVIDKQSLHFTGVGHDSIIVGTANIALIKLRNDGFVSNLRLYGNDRTSASSIGIELGGSSGVSVNVQAIIRNIRFETGFYYGIYSDFPLDQTIIEFCQMLSIITKGAIYIHWDGTTGAKSAGLTIRRCVLQGTSQILEHVNYGIFIAGVDNCLIEQCTVNNWDHNIYIGGDSSAGVWGLIINGFHSEERRTGIFNGTRWSSSLSVSADDIIIPTKANGSGWAYKAQDSGTTGGTEPTWPTTYGGTVVDNTVTWEAVAQSHAIYIAGYIREMEIGGVYALDHIFGIVDASTARIDARNLHITFHDFGFIKKSIGPSYWSIRNSSFDGNYQPYITTKGSSTDASIIFQNINWTNDSLGYAPTEHAFMSDDLDIYNIPWTDYSGTSTITGWSSFTIKEIGYKKIGNLVFVKFRLIGTSDVTNANFTLPLTGEGDINGACWGRDNGGTRAPTLFYVDGSIPDVDIWWGGSATGFTASGTKEAAGHFWYEVA
jgi:hypothetical protein